WKLVESRLDLGAMAQAETLFSTANGYLGLRGAFEEGSPARQHGTFINGFYESWAIPYGETAFGFAREGQTIVNVPDGKIIRLYVDDEPFDLESARILRYRRVLDMQNGTLDREVLWETPAGRQILVESRRLVSFHEKHVAAISYRVTMMNTRAALVLSSEVVDHAPAAPKEDDPRLGRHSVGDVLLPQSSECIKQRLLFSFVTRNSGMGLSCGVDHTLATDCAYKVDTSCAEGTGQIIFHVDAEPNKPIQLTKYITYHTSRFDKTEELRARAGRTLDRVWAHGFDQLLQDQRAYLDDFWARSDIQGGRTHRRAQQCIRWNLFQLLQASARADFAGIPAKGLTSQTYDGHYFWDMEMYVVPFLIYTSPRLARNVLRFRHSLLDKARARARELNQKGALFAWRTINGEEASAYYAAGTAQYHINAAIAHAVVKYVQITGDEAFLEECGAEMLVETARLWYDLGFFSKRQDGRFCIHGVTGPDEYTTVVNNNTYTNLMARENLANAARILKELRQEKPEAYQIIADRTQLKTAELADWENAAELMFIPYDARLGIHPQDESFLDRKVWDFENTPAEKYPLLLHFHPLVIYRHQVIKQADVVLAMYLLGHEFSEEQKRRNFDYYDPLTTGDSSLSACIQSIVAAEIGYEDVARRYFTFALLMDLADVGGNVKDGVHIASMGGTWMAVVYGLAGLRDYEGRISFNPTRIAVDLCFKLTVRGCRLVVHISEYVVNYTLEEGDSLTFTHRTQEHTVKKGQSLRCDI
ncbi:MAG: glycoside hydrolase family 65 protein, partial [Gemmataceae bacterium]